MHSPYWREVAPEEIQNLAHSCIVILAIHSANAGHGHVATVRPQGIAGDQPPMHGRGLRINDIGRTIRIQNENYAFGSKRYVRYYTHK